MKVKDIEELRKEMYATVDKQIKAFEESQPEEKEITRWEDLGIKRGVQLEKSMTKTEFDMLESYAAKCAIYDLMAHPQYNGANQDEWISDMKNIAVIATYRGGETIVYNGGVTTYELDSFLAFRTEEKAELFLKLHSDLIEIAKPLL